MKKEKAYKVFNSDFKCRDFQYEVGKTYTHVGIIQLCGSGFHSCKKINHCFNYYSFSSENKVCEVELMGDIIHGDDKSVCSKIKIIKEFKWSDVLLLANTGANNSGHWNSGHWNSGHSNSGDSNSGDSNSGHSNSGDSNSGDWNSGHGNSGHSNSGAWNSGHWNSGDSNSGKLNTTQPLLRIFNKPTKVENIIYPQYFYFELNEWVNISSMTDKEKENFNWYKTTGGYLKKIDYKEAWIKSFNETTKKDVELTLNLPNFKYKLFEEISGITKNMIQNKIRGV